MDDNMTYEGALKRLNEIIKILEKNDASLDESLKLFEEGTKLSAFCASKLENAEQIITQLTEKSRG